MSWRTGLLGYVPVSVFPWLYAAFGKSLQLSRFFKLADYHLVPYYYFEWLLGRKSEVQAIITAQHSTPAMEFSHTYAWLCHYVYFDYFFILHRKGVLHACRGTYNQVLVSFTTGVIDGMPLIRW